MTELSKEIYSKIDALFPSLAQAELFTTINPAEKGLSDIHLVVFESTPEIIRFVLACHVRSKGKLIANPCFEISVNPKEQAANVVFCMSNDYVFTENMKPTSVHVLTPPQANRFLYDWLQTLQVQGTLPF